MNVMIVSSILIRPVMRIIVTAVLPAQGEMDGIVMVVLRGPTLVIVGDHARPVMQESTLGVVRAHARPVVQERTLGLVRDHARLVPRTPIHRVAARL